MPGTNLTKIEAQERSGVLSVQTYLVELDVTTSDTTFHSRTTVTFTATPGSSSFIDFIGQSVEQVTLNGTDLDPASVYADSRIALADLAEQNTLVVDATALFMNTGEGLHRLVDPVDGEVYLYSQFEVPDSRRMYAVFEQPDQKAEFTFRVTAPDHWKVLSNSPTPEPSPVRDGVATWEFAPTPKISSYITALVAGPYAEVRDEVTTRGGVVPLGIYCRASMLEHLDADNVFAITKAGFDFFEKEFDCAYPFAKYDQIFTPEYNMGAMENAGCVTITEVYVFRSKVTERLIERRALTILHELAHMWFGNLVTMQWWDDLWLNESFAEWASTTCQAEATQWNTAWTTFGTYEKAWAYNQDQLSTTHPIVAPIRDLHDVEVNFDGITYAKGASVLKQLVAHVGREPFVAGLRAYFAKHAWSNTTLSDLLTELETASGRELTSWSKKWLETAGVNTLRPVLEVDGDGVITDAAIEQTHAPDYATLRPHRLGLGLYAAAAGALTRTDYLEIDVDGERTQVPELVGKTQPDLLLVNDNDLAYAKIRFDEKSLATALAHPRGYADSLPHSLVLAGLWDMTRDGELRASDYVPFALAALPGETDSTMVASLIGQATTAALSYAAPTNRPALRTQLVEGLASLAQGATAGSDAQLQFVTAYANTLAVGDDTSWIAGLYDGSQVLDGLSVDTDMRWTLLTALTATGAAGEDAIEAELGRDDTATGRERAARARATIPTAEAKAAAWASAVEGNDLPNSVVEAIGLGFSRGSDRALLEPYVGRYHEMLRSLPESRTHALVEGIVVGFYPMTLASQELFDATQGWLDANTDAPAGMLRLVTENRDALGRALAAQKADAQP